jgi:cellulose synthase/poly-beta-1,6-N-acetylglucosamine synthase-like glycosyltransferase
MNMETLFFAVVYLIFHAYFGYPLSLYLIGLARRRPVRKTLIFPPVTMIITAFNEEKRIRRKLENTIALDYPSENHQILLASDGSTDRTNEIAGEFSGNGVELLAFPERRGKENAQNEAVKRARGDIIVFSDVATILDTGGLKEIVGNFADASVGCVSSEDRLLGRDGRPSGEGFYVRYEMWLRRLESNVGSLVGLSGSFFAARKEVCRDFSEEMQSDFRTVLSSMKMGLRGVCDPRAVGYYHDISDERREFQRKVRTVLRGLTVFFRHPEYLNVMWYGLFSYQYFCHKLLRWLVPFLLGVGLLLNIFLASNSFFFLVLLVLQILFLVTAFIGWRKSDIFKWNILKIPLYFVTVNLSIFVAWWKFVSGHRVLMWTPSER